MAKIHANTDPIQFDNGTADALKSALTGAADAVSGQEASRQGFVSIASQSSAATSPSSSPRTRNTASGDADKIVSTLRTVAGWVDQMKEAAATERANRKKAREWQDREDERNGFQDF